MPRACGKRAGRQALPVVDAGRAMNSFMCFAHAERTRSADALAGLSNAEVRHVATSTMSCTSLDTLAVCRLLEPCRHVWTLSAPRQPSVHMLELPCGLQAHASLHLYFDSHGPLPMSLRHSETLLLTPTSVFAPLCRFPKSSETAGRQCTKMSRTSIGLWPTSSSASTRTSR